MSSSDPSSPLAGAECPSGARLVCVSSSWMMKLLNVLTGPPIPQSTLIWMLSFACSYITLRVAQLLPLLLLLLLETIIMPQYLLVFYCALLSSYCFGLTFFSSLPASGVNEPFCAVMPLAACVILRVCYVWHTVAVGTVSSWGKTRMQPFVFALVSHHALFY